MIKLPTSTTLSKKKKKIYTKQQPKLKSQTTINLTKPFNNNYPLVNTITSHLPNINSNEQFPPLNKINKNVSDNMSEESNSDDDSLPELSKRRNELDQDSEDEDSCEEIDMIIRSRKDNIIYSKGKDQTNKRKAITLPPTKILKPNNKSKRDKQYSTSNEKGNKRSRCQRVGIN